MSNIEVIKEWVETNRKAIADSLESYPPGTEHDPVNAFHYGTLEGGRVVIERLEALLGGMS